MKKVCTKLFPKNFTTDQKFVRQQFSSDVLERLDEDENIITCDETFIFQYDVDTKVQSVESKTPESPRMKKTRMSK